MTKMRIFQRNRSLLKGRRFIPPLYCSDQEFSLFILPLSCERKYLQNNQMVSQSESTNKSRISKRAIRRPLSTSDRGLSGREIKLSKDSIKIYYPMNDVDLSIKSTALQERDSQVISRANLEISPVVDFTQQSKWIRSPLNESSSDGDDIKSSKINRKTDIRTNENANDEYEFTNSSNKSKKVSKLTKSKFLTPVISRRALFPFASNDKMESQTNILKNLDEKRHKNFYGKENRRRGDFSVEDSFDVGRSKKMQLTHSDSLSKKLVHTATMELNLSQELSTFAHSYNHSDPVHKVEHQVKNAAVARSISSNKYNLK